VIALIKTAGAVGVGSGALLGIVILFAIFFPWHFWRSLGCLWFALLNSLLEIRIFFLELRVRRLERLEALDDVVNDGVGGDVLNSHNVSMPNEKS
jgi:hypothetical protein